MFGIDFEALILLAILAFILFGPEKLPEYAAKLGYYIAKLREATTDLHQQCQSSFPEFSQQLGNQPAASQGTPDQLAAGESSLTGDVCHMCCQPLNKDFAFCPRCGHRIDEFADTGHSVQPEKTSDGTLTS